jgi:hypothetical protein
MLDVLGAVYVEFYTVLLLAFALSPREWIVFGLW